ncbi:hypothetical protein SH449x_002366 [Pirellulaceae bacterium SH449]
MFVAIALLLVSIPACRQAAFNEFYVETMAAEIRALEDRIYEYDSAYQTLEMENEDLRAKHERLQKKLRDLEEESGVTVGSKPSRTAPRTSQPSPSKDSSDTFDLIVPGKSKNEEATQIVPKTPVSPPDSKSDNPLPLPGLPASGLNATEPAESVLPKIEEGGILPPPSGGNTSLLPSKSKSKTDLKAGDLVEEYTMPPAFIRSAQQPASPNLVSPQQSPSTQPTPNSTPRLPSLPGTFPDASQGRIRVPQAGGVITASATEIVQTNRVDSVHDQRVIAIDFHPTLCRGINLDNQPGDDGLYLVITPRNDAGQIVNNIGKITIVAEETIDNKTIRLSAWEIDPEEMEEYLEPIGPAQGYHLRLPWQSDSPRGRNIQVFAKCEFEDGRKPVNRREIVLSKSSIRPLTWTPRQ